MKDFLDKDLKVGNYVVILQTSRSCAWFEHGYIHKFTPKMVCVVRKAEQVGNKEDDYYWRVMPEKVVLIDD